MTITVKNTMHFVARPGFTVDKGVSLSASGPFVSSLTTATGRTLHYRITITNTGNVLLTGVTLSDNTYDLAAKGCTIPTTLAVGAHYDCNYTATAVTGTTTNVATGDTAETGPDTGTATVVANPEPNPALAVEKSVSLSASGPWVSQLTVTTGTTVFYRITIINTGNADLTGVTLTDNKFDLGAKGCVIPGTLAIGAHYDCNYSTTAVTGTTVNTATGDSAQTGPATDTATVVASLNPTLTIDKTNNAPLSSLELPTASEGDTVTFTLSYSFTGDSVSSGSIKDVLPPGLTYVAGSATSNDEFSFVGYNAGTRTLSWTAEDVTKSGSVTYKATVDTGAAGLTQPLKNVATIASEETDADTANSVVYVAVPPQAETSVPTPPSTDTIGSTDTSTPGSSLLLVLLALAGIALAVVFVAPMPTSVRNRIRR